MNLDNYDYNHSNSGLDYEFESAGPNGIIKKVVRFSPIGKNIYNLGFGDLDEKTGEISDFAVSDNKDTDKVLATIAAIAWYFTDIFPGAAIYIKGTTPSRTRLYQMKITEHWELIGALFEVQGLRQGRWSLFEKKVNYEAFLARRHEGAFFDG